MIRSALYIDQQTSPVEIVGFCEKIDQLLWKLVDPSGQDSFKQKWVAVDVELQLPSKRLGWKTKTRGSPLGLVSGPFVLPALIARKLAEEKVISHDSFAYTKLYEAVAGHYSRILPSGINRKDFPGIWSEASSVLSVSHDIKELLKSPNAIRLWDASIVQTSSEEVTRALPEYHERADFIAPRFQRASTEEVYYTPSLLPIIERHAEPVPVARCQYKVGAGCCEGTYLETLAKWLGTNADPQRFSQFLETERGLNQLRNVTRSMVAIDVILLTPDGVPAKERSGNVGAYPGLFMLIPAGQLEPEVGWDPQSIFWSVMHELDEELFGGDKRRILTRVKEEEHIRDLSGNITYLGYGVELMNNTVVFFVLLEPSGEWWARYKTKVTSSWEHVGKWCKYIDLDQPPDNLCPGVYSGIELARRALHRRNMSDGA